MANSFDPMKRQIHSPLIGLSLALGVISVVIAGFAFFRGSNNTVAGLAEDRLDNIKKAGVLRVGYGGYPPYTIVGNGGAPPTGFSIDLVDAIASRTSPPFKLQWQQFSFDTMKADLQADRFDFIADPVFITVARSADFAFTIPYSYFGIAVGLVRADDDRFKSFGDLDQPGITIVLAEGWTSSEYARANLKKPNLRSVPVTGDATSQLDEVLAGRADVALNDVPTVLQYVRAHPGRVKALWLSSPPSSVPGAFVLRLSDNSLRAFLNSSLRALQVDGTLETLDKKWSSLGFFPTITLRPGAGIVGTTAAISAGGR